MALLLANVLTSENLFEYLVNFPDSVVSFLSRTLMQSQEFWESHWKGAYPACTLCFHQILFCHHKCVSSDLDSYPNSMATYL